MFNPFKLFPFNSFKAEIMTKLADIIRALTEQEKAEGLAILKAIEALKASLAASDVKISELSAQIATHSEELVGVSELQSQISALQSELSEATEAAQLISEINAAPTDLNTSTENEAIE